MTQQRALAQHQPSLQHPQQQAACSVPGLQAVPTQHCHPLPGSALVFWGQPAPWGGTAPAPTAVPHIPGKSHGIRSYIVVLDSDHEKKLLYSHGLNHSSFMQACNKCP